MLVCPSGLSSLQQISPVLANQISQTALSLVLHGFDFQHLCDRFPPARFLLFVCLVPPGSVGLYDPFFGGGIDIQCLKENI